MFYSTSFTLHLPSQATPNLSNNSHCSVETDQLLRNSLGQSVEEDQFALDCEGKNEFCGNEVEAKLTNYSVQSLEKLIKFRKTSEKNVEDFINFNSNSFQQKIINFNNLIIYGPPASGKYTQSLYIIKQLSPSLLKYHNKIVFQNDKICFSFPISDIHYEIDISLLGCNSKVVFFELLLHIIDVISVNPLKFGIILCKNFDSIHSELLETFYSYMQKFNINTPNINIYFIIITESISFIPNNIINVCNILYVPKPDLKLYTDNLIKNYIYTPDNFSSQDTENGSSSTICSEESINLSKLHSEKIIFGSGDAFSKNVNFASTSFPQNSFLSSQDTANWSSSTICPEESLKYLKILLSSPFYSKKFCNEITNLKEIDTLVLLYLSCFTENSTLISKKLISSTKFSYEKINNFNQDDFFKKIPKKIFNIVSDNIINEIINYKNISMSKFRESIYDILTYNLNVYDCVWYVINYFVENSKFIGSPFLSKNGNLPSQATANCSSSTLRTDESLNLPSQATANCSFSERSLEYSLNKITLTDKQVTDIIKKTYIFFKHYNNNYRPIYHLENIFYYIITVIHNLT